VVKRQKVDRTIRTIGTIEFDQSKLATIAAYVDGRLERLYADYVGVPVQEGDDLALLYSPDLYTAMVEYLTAIERSQASRLLDQSRLVMLAEEKLRELGLTEEQIEEIRRSGQIQARIRIKSPQRGTVIEKPVVEGDYVKTGQTIYRVADLSTVWLMLDLFPDDASAIRFGQEVEAELDSAPGIVFTGRVAFIDPTVNPRTRTIRVRVEMLNLDGRLRPGDYATARVRVPAIPRDVVYDPALAGKYISPMHPQIIRDAPGKCPICDMDLIPTSQLGFSDTPLPDETVITVPRKAVLMAGGNSVVYVETEPGRFEIRRVTIAALTDDLAIIAGGLKPGEIVATDGNFLIDSQSQLAGNPSLLDPSKAPEYPPGPLELPEVLPVVLSGAAGQMLDSAAQAYFEIQAALAADAEAPRVAVNQLIQALSQVAASGAIRDAELLQDLQTSLDAAEHLPLSLDTARLALRRISHGMLRVLNRYRGPQTAVSLFHFYCPMVPGGGGDWMQADPELKNPYWGSQMLTCGELVRNMGQTSSQSVDVLPTIANPFDGMPLQTLEAGDDGEGNAATPHDR
ncbi:MAG: HlyD family efflux transporter periplasmic adaptor subunit, partial [Planctomycetota bacterium]